MTEGQRLLHCIVLVGLASWAWAAQEPTERLKSKRVLIVGVDGMRPDALGKAHTPNLDALIETGAFTEATQILGARYVENDTVSGPGWSSILTGVWADKHGVNDNRFQNKNYSRHPHFFNYVKASLPGVVTVSMVSWAPIDEHIVSAADLRHVEHLPRGPDRARLDREQRMDTNMAARAAEILTRQDPTAIFVYFHQVDAAGHEIGFHPDVPEYLRAIENADKHVGTIMRAIHDRANYGREDWLIIVCTDHGGFERRHGGGHLIPEIRTVFLIVSGESSLRGRISGETYLVDVVPTALSHLGVNIDQAWELDGRPVGLLRTQ